MSRIMMTVRRILEPKVALVWYNVVRWIMSMYLGLGMVYLEM